MPLSNQVFIPTQGLPKVVGRNMKLWTISVFSSHLKKNYLTSYCCMMRNRLVQELCKGDTKYQSSMILKSDNPPLH